MNRKTEFTFDEIIGKVDTSLAEIDRLRTEKLEKMAIVQQVNAKALEKERQRLSLKYGENHPRVQRLDAKLQFDRGFTSDLKVEIDKSKIQVPTVDKKTWLVHGRVLDRTDNQGIQGLTVSLVNNQEQWVRELGYACTDERGYFAIAYPPKNRHSDTAIPKESVFLMVSDRDRRVLYRSSEPLSVELGQMIYREIFLSQDTRCTAPPHTEPPDVPVETCSIDDAPTQLQTGDLNVSEPAADVWVARGRVVDERGEGIGGLVVSLFDRDLIFDDRLLTTQTDENGEFIVTYRTADFQDLFDANPDLYLKILDAEGNTLYSCEEAVRCEADRVEVFEITLPRNS
jgi:hypothetical protein